MSANEDYVVWQSEESTVKKIGLGIVSAVLLLTMAGGVSCASRQPEDESKVHDMPGTEASLMKNENAEPVKKEPIADLEDAYELVLNNCSRSFIGGHVIDESFMGWMHANYGEDTVLALANHVQDGGEDAGLWYELTGNSIHVLWLLYCQDTGLSSDDLDNVYWQETADSERIVLNFTGDINFSEGWVTTTHMDGQPGGIYDCFSEDLLEEMNSADIMMINNEFTYSDRGEPLAGKDYTFRAKPDRVELLDVFGTDIAGVANNHVYDYGPDALLDTLSTLREAEIPYVGAGENLKEASKPVYFVANGKKIAIVAATQIERSLNYTKEATDTMPGVLKTLNADKYVKVIEQARDNSDYVIAFVHWGTEGDDRYGQDQVNLAHQFVEAGADVIIGGHTHCLQGIQYIDGVPVIYSLGNFWFSASALDTGMSQVVIHSDGSIDFRFLPCIQKNLTTSLVTEQAEKERIFRYVESISTDISIDSQGYVTDQSDL